MMPQFRDESYDINRKLLELLEGLAKEKNASMAQISLAWMLNKKPYIVPIPGTRKASRMQENADAAEVVLTEEEVRSIDDALDRMELSGVYGGAPIESAEEKKV